MQIPLQLQPRQLSYPTGVPETPKSSRSSLPSSPATPDFNPSPTSLQSSLTPSLQSLSLGRGRGRPRKQLIKPEGFPVDGTEVDKQRWFCQKCTEQWRFWLVIKLQDTEQRRMQGVRLHTMPGRKRRQQVQELEPPLRLLKSVRLKILPTKPKSRVDYGM